MSLQKRMSSENFEEMETQEIQSIKQSQTFSKKYYTPKSLNWIPYNNPIRKLCIKLIEWNRFEQFITFVIILNSIFLGMVDYTDQNQDNLRNQIVSQSEPVFVAIFSLECIVKIVAMGFIFDKNCYLRDPWYWLDFIVVITAIIDLMPSVGSVSSLRTFRLFRPLRSLSALDSMRVLVNTLLFSIIQFGYLSLLALFFFGVFSILGINLFGGLTDYRCRQTPYPVNGDWLVVSGDQRTCSESGGIHQCSVACGSLYDYSASQLYNVTDLSRDSYIPELNWGITNFNYIWSSLLTIFQCATIEGWYKLLLIIADSYNFIITAIFFTLLILICNYFLLNLTVAVMLQQYTNQQDFNQKLIQNIKKQFGKENLQEILKLRENKAKVSKKCTQQNENKINIKELIVKTFKLLVNTDIEIPDSQYYKYKITKFSYFLVSLNSFQTFIFLLIIINTIILSFDKYPLPSNSQQAALYVINQAFTYIFLLEAVFKLIGLGVRNYFFDKFNLLDFVVVSLSMVQLGMQFAFGNGNSSGSAISALRAFRLMRLIKFVIKWDSLKLLIDSITHTISAIGNFTILLFLFIYVYSLLGMQFFAGQLKFDAKGYKDLINGTSPRANFDSLLWAFVTVFQVLVGDGWNDVMYSCIRGVGYGSIVYFVTLVVFGNIILLNLFLAIIIGNFEEASKLMKEMKFTEEVYNFHLQRQANMQSLFGVTILDQNTNNNKFMFQNDKNVSIKSGKSNQVTPININQERKSLQYKDQSNTSPRKDMNFENDIIEEEDEIQESELDGEVNLNKFRKDLNNLGKEPNDSSYDSSFTQIDMNYVGNPGQLSSQRNQSSNQQEDKEEGKRPSDSFDAKQFVNQIKMQENRLNQQKAFKSAKERKSNAVGGQPREQIKIFIEDADPSGQRVTQIKNKQYQSKSVLLGSPKHELLNFEVNPSDLRNLNNNNNQISNGIGRNGMNDESPSSKRISINDGQRQNQRKSLRQSKSHLQIVPKSTTSINPNNVSRISTRTPNAIRNMAWYRERGRFYKCINYIRRSSLCLLHKRSWLRIQLIKLVIPIKPKVIRTKTGIAEQLKQQDDQELLQQILDSEASSESDNNEYGDEYLEESEVMDPENEITPKDTTLKEDGSVLARNTQKILKSQQTFESQRALVTDNSTKMAQLNKSKVGQQRKKISRKSSKIQQEEKRKKREIGADCCKASYTKFNKIFENLVLGLIVLSSLVLILDNPLNNPRGSYAIAIKLIDTIFTFLFLTEAIIKILAFGLVKTSLKNQNPYLYVGWNLLDLFVVIASLIDFCYQPAINFDQDANVQISTKSSLKSLKALRALRALRPLKVINKNEGLKLVVNALFSSLPSLFNVMIMNALFIIIFAIIGINFFKGTFFSCKLKVLNQDTLDMVDNKFDCLNYGGNWLNGDANFDNIQQAALTLFQLMTVQGWLKISYQGVDARGIDLQPKQNTQQFWIFYFIFFIIIGNMFFLNLFVGVVIVNFNRMKDKLCGYVNMTEEQRKWIEMQRYMIRIKLMIKKEKPSSALQGICIKIVNTQVFEIGIMIVIITNTIFMSMKYNNMPQEYSNALEIANYVFTGIFNVECIMKIIALQKLYFYNYWNVFDFIVVLAANLGVVFKVVNTGSNIAIAATVIRSFRIIRIFRLIKASQNMKVLIDTLLHILPSLINVAALISLMLFIYASLGINLFATVKYNEYINEDNNFRSFGMALLVLFRCATGENWNDVMNELASTHGQECIDNQNYDSMQAVGIQGCGTPISYFYFTSFIISVQMIVMNLFIAVVIEGFCSSTNENSGPVTSENYMQLVEKWADYDNNAVGWISVSSLAFLIYELDYPLGRKNEYEEQLRQRIEQDSDQKRFKQFDYRSKFICNSDKNMILPQRAGLKLMMDLDLPVYNNHKVHFKDVCIKLTKNAINKQQIGQTVTDFDGINEIQKQRLERDWSKAYAGLRKQHKIMIQGKYAFNTKMYWAGAFIFKILKIMRDNQRANRQKEWISQSKKSSGIINSIKKQKYEKRLQELLEQKELEEQLNEEKMLDNTEYFVDEPKYNKQGTQLDQIEEEISPNQRRTSGLSMKPEIEKKVKDTERSTWWQKKSSRMEKWLVNQERRQIKKKNQIQPQQTSVRQTQQDKPSVLTFYPSVNQQQNQQNTNEIEIQVPTAKFNEISPENTGNFSEQKNKRKKKLFSVENSIKSVSSSSSSEQSQNKKVKRNIAEGEDDEAEQNES